MGRINTIEMKEELIRVAREKGFTEELMQWTVDPYYTWLCLLHKWLRENHNISIEVTMRKGVASAVIVEENNSKYHIGECGSYQEALERSALASLRILKTKSDESTNNRQTSK